jgi:NAD(P)H-hydrate epimerase
MARAGRAAFRLLQSCWPAARRIAVICGTGNNGGDGFVLARLAHESAIQARVLLVGAPARVGGDALRALDAARAAGVPLQAFDAAAAADADLLVDALLGTGLTGAVRAEHAAAIGWINAATLPVLAIDLPSGLCSDTGAVLGAAVRATHTISFIGRKRGLYTGAAPALAGTRHFDGLDVPGAVYEAVAPAARLLAPGARMPALAPRARNAHKGHFGHVLVIGGNAGMGGAAALAAEAAARCGAGLVSVAVHPGNETAVLARRPEAMARAVRFAHELEPLLARASVIVAGPGLGRGPWAQQLLGRALAARLPTVLDADALNALAAGEVGTAHADPARWILTPHPGEAARLLGASGESIARDRFAALAELLARYSGTVVLKGAGTLVGSACDADRSPGVCAHGNPGMASGGMGDVLSGVLGALLAQGLAPAHAARLGVWLHARAADLAAHEGGERGLLATDLMPWLRRLLNAAEPA